MDKQLPIMNDPIVKEYMSMLFDNNQHKEYDNTKGLVEYIESMEKQFEILTQELRDIKEQLNSMQNPIMKMRMQSTLNKTQDVVDISMNKLNDLKTNLKNSMKDCIQSFKQHGRSGIVKMIDLLHIRDGLNGLQKTLIKALNRTNHMIQTVDSMTVEMKNAKRNIKNIGLLLVGKKANHENHDLSKLNFIQRSSRSMHQLFKGMAMKTSKMMNQLDNFKRESVRGHLKLISSQSNHQKNNKNINKDQIR